MNHDEAVRQKAPERYLLDELESDVRDQFEEHLFECQDCALDVRTTAMFIEQSKVILAEKAETSAVRVPVQVAANAGWLAWLRPSFAAPVLALLLAVIGYQNFPNLTAGTKKPRVLTAASINLMTYGSNPSPLVVPRGEEFLLNVVVPPTAHYLSYKALLYNPAGEVEFPLTIKGSAEDVWPIVVPAKNRPDGKYSVEVVGLDANGKENKVGSGSFELQAQK